MVERNVGRLGKVNISAALEASELGAIVFKESGFRGLVSACGSKKKDVMAVTVKHFFHLDSDPNSNKGLYSSATKSSQTSCIWTGRFFDGGFFCVGERLKTNNACVTPTTREAMLRFGPGPRFWCEIHWETRRYIALSL